jgi:hypothetical protein
MTPDIVANDKESGRILIVEVKDAIKDVDRDFFMEELRRYASALGQHSVVYYLLVDRKVMRLFEERNSQVTSLVDLDTLRTLRNYMAHEPSARFSEGFLAGLTQAWLRDLALKWKSDAPEGRERLTPELLDLLHHADIRAA